MKAKLKGQKIVASVVIAAMSIAFIPKVTGNEKVFADVAKSTSNTCLGTSRIASPVAPASDDSDWSGSYVYYGGKKFRVLAPRTTAYGGSTLFLDSDAVLFGKRFDDDSHAWVRSELRTYLNESFLTSTFTSAEQGAIAASTVSAHDLVEGTGAGQVSAWTKGAFGQYVALNGDKIFVLDAEEVSNISYGYSNTSLNAASREKGGLSNNYWLRSSSGTTTPVGAVTSGFVIVHTVNDESKVGVAPALNVNLSKVLFSTAVDGTMGQVGTAYKLTVLDSNLSVTAGSLSVNGSTFSCAATGNADRVSLLITDGVWNSSGSSIKYYGEYTGSFDLSSAGLSADDWGTKYKVYLVAEDFNEDTATDYASKPLLIERSERKGWVEEGGKKYYYENGKPVIGWKEISFVYSGTRFYEWYYFDANGVMQTGIVTIDGKKYLFSTSGYCARGLSEYDGKVYYSTKDEGIATGWKGIDGDWYFFDSTGVMQTGWKQVGGKWYYLDSEGVMATGWKQVDGRWYYLNPGSGDMATGWKQVGGKWYYFRSDGVMVTSWQQIGGKWYYFKADGVMVTGWQEIGGKWYYFKADGVMVTGWQEISSKWYYFNAGGDMVTGWKQIGGKWYYFKDNGAMNTGWIQLSGKWYYMLSSGEMLTGTKTIGGKTYNFNNSGVCLNP